VHRPTLTARVAVPALLSSFQITKDEFVKVVQAAQLASKEVKQVKEEIKSMDTDGDGKVSAAEIRAAADKAAAPPPAP